MRTRILDPLVSRERTAVRLAKMSRGRLTTALHLCGYSKPTAVLAAQVFDEVITAAQIMGKPQPPTDDDVHEVLEQMRELLDGLSAAQSS